MSWQIYQCHDIHNCHAIIHISFYSNGNHSCLKGVMSCINNYIVMTHDKTVTKSYMLRLTQVYRDNYVISDTVIHWHQICLKFSECYWLMTILVIAFCKPIWQLTRSSSLLFCFPFSPDFCSLKPNRTWFGLLARPEELEGQKTERGCVHGERERERGCVLGERDERERSPQLDNVGVKKGVWNMRLEMRRCTMAEKKTKDNWQQRP
jgi:hypothetical protein